MASLELVIISNLSLATKYDCVMRPKMLPRTGRTICIFCSSPQNKSLEQKSEILYHSLHRAIVWLLALLNDVSTSTDHFLVVLILDIISVAIVALLVVAGFAALELSTLPLWYALREGLGSVSGLQPVGHDLDHVICCQYLAT